MLEVNIYVVPDGKTLCETFVKSRVRVFDSAQRLVREDDAKTKCVVRRIALPDFDPVLGVEQLDQRRQI